MMSSILLNPQLLIYSAALGPTMLAVRIISCFVCGCTAGVLVRAFAFGAGQDSLTFQDLMSRAARHPSQYDDSIFLKNPEEMLRQQEYIF